MESLCSLEAVSKDYVTAHRTNNLTEVLSIKKITANAHLWQSYINMSTFLTVSVN